MSLITLDLETSIYNTGNPFDTRNFIVTAHIKEEDQLTKCYFYDEPDFRTKIQQAMRQATLLVGVNIKFDLHHCRNMGLQLRDGCRVWDCMLAEFILSGQTNPFASLNELAEKYNLGKKEDVVAEYWEKGISTESIPRDIVSSYGNTDVDLTYAVYTAQLADNRMSPELHRLILLDGCDLLVLTEMEWNGFLYDVQGSRAKAASLEAELKEKDEELLKMFDKRINLESGDQLSCALYGGEYSEDVYASEPATYQSGIKKGQEYIRRQFSHTEVYHFPRIFEPIKGSALKKEGFYSTAEDVLLQLKAKTKQQKRVIELLLRRAYLSKLCGTYLTAFPALIEEIHWADNTIHGQFNQTIARTGRLSSSKPNMQNAPEEVDEFFITRYAG